MNKWKTKIVMMCCCWLQCESCNNMIQENVIETRVWYCRPIFIQRNNSPFNSLLSYEKFTLFQTINRHLLSDSTCEELPILSISIYIITFGVTKKITRVEITTPLSHGIIPKINKDDNICRLTTYIPI